jgi:hypothetical protein
VAEPQTPPTNDPAPQDPPADPPKTYTQEELQRELNRVGATQKAEGRLKAVKDLGEKLGIADLDEAKLEAIVKAQKDQEDKDKSEIQRATERAEQAETKLRDAESKTAKTEHDNKVKLELLGAGVPKAKLDRAFRNVSVEVGADDAAIAADIDAIKTDLPDLFSGTAEPKVPLPNSDPSKNPSPNQPPPGTTAAQRGTDRAKSWLERHK